jgi:hypothetical protein
MLIRNLLEPHDLRSIGLTVLGIIALDCAIADGTSHFFGFILIEVTSLTGLAIANPHCAIILALLGHDIVLFHFCFLSTHLSTPCLFVGTLYKTLDIRYQVCYNQRQLRKMLSHQS